MSLIQFKGAFADYFWEALEEDPKGINPGDIRAIYKHLPLVFNLQKNLRDFLKTCVKQATNTKVIPKGDVEKRKNYFEKQIADFRNMWQYTGLVKDAKKKADLLSSVTGSTEWRQLRAQMSTAFSTPVQTIPQKSLKLLFTFAPTQELEGQAYAFKYCRDAVSGDKIKTLYEFEPIKQPLDQRHLHIFDLRGWHSTRSAKSSATFAKWDTSADLHSLISTSENVVTEWILLNVLESVKYNTHDHSGLKAYILFCKSMLPQIQNAIVLWNHSEHLRAEHPKTFTFRFDHHTFSSPYNTSTVWFGQLYLFSRRDYKDFQNKNPSSDVFLPPFATDLFTTKLQVTEEVKEAIKEANVSANRDKHPKTPRYKHPAIASVFWEGLFSPIPATVAKKGNNKPLSSKWVNLLSKTECDHPTIEVHFFSATNLMELLPHVWKQNINLIVDDRTFTKKTIKDRNAWKPYYGPAAALHQNYIRDMKQIIYPSFPEPTVKAVGLQGVKKIVAVQDKKKTIVIDEQEKSASSPKKKGKQIKKKLTFEDKQPDTTKKRKSSPEKTSQSSQTAKKPKIAQQPSASKVTKCKLEFQND